MVERVQIKHPGKGMTFDLLKGRCVGFIWNLGMRSDYNLLAPPNDVTEAMVACKDSVVLPRDLQQK